MRMLVSGRVEPEGKRMKTKVAPMVCDNLKIIDCQTREAEQSIKTRNLVRKVHLTNWFSRDSPLAFKFFVLTHSREIFFLGPRLSIQITICFLWFLLPHDWAKNYAHARDFKFKFIQCWDFV